MHREALCEDAVVMLAVQRTGSRIDEIDVYCLECDALLYFKIFSISQSSILFLSRFYS